MSKIVSKKLTVFLLLLITVAISASAFAHYGWHGKHRSVWSQKKVGFELEPSQSEIIELSFTAPKNISKASLVISKRLRPYIKVNPPHLENLMKGETVNVSLEATIPNDAREGIRKGFLFIKGNKKRIAGKVLIKTSVVWNGQFKDDSLENRIAFKYPSFGRPSRVLVIDVNDDIRRYAIQIQSDDGIFVDEMFLNVVNYTDGLDTWLMTNIDPEGLLFSTSTYSPFYFYNGTRALILENEIPEDFAEIYGPVSFSYGITPTGDQIFIANISQASEIALSSGSESASKIIKGFISNIKF